MVTIGVLGIASCGLLYAQARTVWDGVYTTGQAERGKIQYLASCGSCHVEDLRGDGRASALVGNDFLLQWSDLSINDLLVRTRNTMPQDSPRSLSEETYMDILTYIFQVNKFPAGEEELKPDTSLLKSISITKSKK